MKRTVNDVNPDINSQHIMSFDPIEPLPKPGSCCQFLMENTAQLVFRSKPSGEIIFWNNLFLSTLGYSADDINGIHLNHLFDKHEAFEKITNSLKNNHDIEISFIQFRRKDGSLLVGKLNAKNEIDTDGSKIITWIVLDNTHQYESELVLKKRNEELTKVNAQMEKFLYSASHDLRSPLTSILGLTNLLRIEHGNIAINKYVDRIERSVESLDNVIKEIVGFSKNSYQRLQSEKVFLEPLIWKIIKTHKNIGPYKRIKFEVTVEENDTFYSDTERLEIILNNIIRNAIIFSDINKSSPFVTVKADAANDGLNINILDNGIGIGKSHLDNIFSMFYRASDRSKGSGLGLYVVKEAVERLKGNIEVESEIGFGTMFRVTIPNDLKGKLVSRKTRLLKTRL